MSMVERVALAIGKVSIAGQGRSDSELLEACARAAIEAMREPTPEMLKAVERAEEDQGYVAAAYETHGGREVVADHDRRRAR